MERDGRGAVCRDLADRHWLDEPRRADARQELPSEADRAIQRRRALFSEQPRQGAPRGELHGEEKIAVLFTKIEGAHDVGVVHPTGEAHLLAEPRHTLSGARQLGAEDLERDDLVQGEIPRLVHHAHPARAQKTDHLVAPVEHRRGRRHLDGV